MSICLFVPPMEQYHHLVGTLSVADTANTTRSYRNILTHQAAVFFTSGGLQIARTSRREQWAIRTVRYTAIRSAVRMAPAISTVRRRRCNRASPITVSDTISISNISSTANNNSPTPNSTMLAAAHTKLRTRSTMRPLQTHHPRMRPACISRRSKCCRSWPTIRRPAFGPPTTAAFCTMAER